MKYQTGYFTALTLAALLVAMTGCSSSNNPVGPTDTVAPTVTYTSPANGANGVTIITATFSEAMTASTISAATFTLSGPGVTRVTGTVAYNSSTHMATFTPIDGLAPSTRCAATITTGCQDMSGNPMASNRVWNFSTSNNPLRSHDEIDSEEGPSVSDRR
jgi:Bacterial Ig-like domain